MHVEDNVPIEQIKKLDYRELSFYFDLIKYTLNFIFAPLPSQIDNFFRLSQFIENILVFMIMALMVNKSLKVNKKETIFWIFALLFACAVYGMITHNPGSISRWRFPFIATWILVFNYISMGYKRKYVKI